MRKSCWKLSSVWWFMSFLARQVGRNLCACTWQHAFNFGWLSSHSETIWIGQIQLQKHHASRKETKMFSAAPSSSQTWPRPNAKGYFWAFGTAEGASGPSASFPQSPNPMRHRGYKCGPPLTTSVLLLLEVNQVPPPLHSVPPPSRVAWS